MTDTQKVDNYIEKHAHWEEELSQLRAIFNESTLKEEIKWGSPAYVLHGKIVAGLGAFQNHLGIWFHQGVFLKDTHKKLMNAQEGKTKALRQFRINKGDTIDTTIVQSYIQEAIENSLAGKEIKPVRIITPTAIPPLLDTAFKKDSELEAAFQAITPGKQREYAGYISEAKREATQLSRLDKITPMIKEGKGLHDKYKNC